MKLQQITAKKLWVRTAVLTLFAFFALFLLLRLYGSYSAKPLSFSLTDHNGAPYSSLQDHKYKLVFFGFTRCADICPIALENMRNVYDALADKKAAIHPIYITVDPDRDTAETLQMYVGIFGSELTGLTGSRDELHDVYKLFSVYAKKVLPSGREEYIIDHTAHIYLTGKNDMVLEVFDYNMPAGQMAAKIERHLP